MKNYTFDQHRYNFAVWTAARAVQRGFKNSKTKNIATLFSEIKLVETLDASKIKSEEDYDNFQRKICKTAIKVAKDLGIDLSYGRASKLVAIFVKTYYILPEGGKGNISKFAHPPIDKILLENSKGEHSLRPIPKWTLMDEKGYFAVINEFRKLKLPSFWMLEKYWNID